jgi:hypothetical protein
MNLNPDSWLARDMALHGDHGQVDPAYEALCDELQAAEHDDLTLAEQAILADADLMAEHARTVADAHAWEHEMIEEPF